MRRVAAGLTLRVLELGEPGPLACDDAGHLLKVAALPKKRRTALRALRDSAEHLVGLRGFSEHAPHWALAQDAVLGIKKRRGEAEGLVALDRTAGFVAPPLAL